MNDRWHETSPGRVSVEAAMTLKPWRHLATGHQNAAMAAGKGRQSYLNSLRLKEHTFTALWGFVPQGAVLFPGNLGPAG